MNANHTTAISACSFEIQANNKSVQLLPAGTFKARDGRPADVPARHWYTDAALAAHVIAKASALATDIVIDYEHQTLNAENNGQPAPAAGWLQGAALEWREGQGLFATGVQWTPSAAAMVKAREYRYLSPVFRYDRQTGAVLELLHVGLTNFPALDGMESLPALAAARFQSAAPESSPATTTGIAALSAEALHCCRMMNVSAADYLATLRAGQD
jgi:phage I-like protein